VVVVFRAADRPADGFFVTIAEIGLNAIRRVRLADPQKP
jgi:hypothetical protein